MTLVKPRPDKFVLATFLREQSLDIRKFGFEIPILAMGAGGEVQFFSTGRKAGSSSVSVADEMMISTYQGQLDQSGGPWQTKPARPVLCSLGSVGHQCQNVPLGSIGPLCVTGASWFHKALKAPNGLLCSMVPLSVTMAPWFQEAVKCLNGHGSMRPCNVTMDL